MPISDRKRDKALVADALSSTSPTALNASQLNPTLVTVIAPKGGVGKTLLARTIIDRHRAAGLPVRIVQIDRTPQLPDLYGDFVSVVSLPSAEEQRADPLASMMAMEPFAQAIDATLADLKTLVTDVGGGPSASATVQYIGKARLDAHIADRGRSVVFLPCVSDPATMSQSVALGRAIETAYPSARIVVVLNERDGRFKFFPGSAADEVWGSKVAPFLQKHAHLIMPPVAAGALAPFDALGLTFTDAIETEAVDLGRRLGISRAIAATLQGDVAEWLSTMWTRLDPILLLATGGKNGRSE